MSEMVERVARAIHTAQDGLPFAYERDALSLKDVRVLARAAILAMREPTEGMLSQYFEGNPRETFVYHWQKGIDEALR